MSTNQIHLLGTKRFLPLFLVQFLGAFNDNVFKNAVLILATFQLADLYDWKPEIVTQIIAGLFIIPFFLFSSFAGQLADKFEKAGMVRYVKAWELFAMLVGSVGLISGLPWILFVTLFLMGAQSAFFGPLKYSLLPFHLREDELVAGNAIFEAATFLSILVGTIFGGLLIVLEDGTLMVSVAVVLIAVVGWVASLWVPRASPLEGALKINWNIFSATTHLIGYAATQRGVFRSILGLSWFWLIGAFWLTLVPAYVRNHLHGSQFEVTSLLVIFAVGIGLGSLLCNRILRGEITAKYVPLAGLGMAAFMIDVAVMTAGLGDRFVAEAFSFASATGVRVIIDLGGIAICGGLFSVPLYAMIQAWAEPAHRSRVIAANNVMNALFMTLIAVVAAGMFAAGWSTTRVILILAVANIGVSIYVVTLVPESMVHTVFRWLMRVLYKVELRGLENYGKARKRRVIIANHTSFLDAALLTIFLPDRPTFAINTQIARKWWMRPFLWAVNVHPLDPTKPMAIKALTALAREGVPIVIFPEGRITVTGALMKVYEGPGLVAEKADADLLPVQIDGAVHTPLSRMRGKARLRWFPKITLTILPPRVFHPPAELRGREKRRYMAEQLYEILADMYLQTADTDRTLFESLLDAAAIHGRGFSILTDLDFKPASYRRLLAASLFLGPKLTRGTEVGEPVGLLIANSIAAVAAFFGVQSSGRVCAMLNYSAGPANLRSACQTAKLRVVWTSRRFVEMAKLGPAVQAMEGTGAQIRYLEDIARRSLPGRLGILVNLVAPGWVYRTRGRPHVDAGGPAIILFTSGSSGAPKAVVLSHRNLQTNRHQLTARIDFNRQDRMFNCLPIFHAFGLTGGTLAPLLAGVPVFMYPTPLHFGIIPELVYQTNSTLLFGTNTFLAGYLRKAHPYDFFSVRYVFAGAEKLKAGTRDAWMERFGVRIFEGYGATETAPALTLNTPMHNKSGTVGCFLPGIEWRTEPVPGVDAEHPSQGKVGRLFVRGGNIMLGYYKADRPGELQPPEEGWYDTGDIVAVDAEGFVRILGRAKRFAKIAGEMVSLTAVEELAAAVWPEHLHAALARSHPSKGEEIVLVTEKPDPDRGALARAARESGIPEIAVPRVLIHRAHLPVLGSGKPDYVTLERENEVKPD
ncbi:MAG: acyl-[ACP]--phospholipid O-acyltransferase [Opitutaceae bacterium]